MRIVGGKFRGKKLAPPRSQSIRPTTDRTRESLFNILSHKIALQDMRVIDLFAGTGALGLEALSRGAGFCLFIDQGAESRALLRTNIEAMGLQGVTRIFRRDATKPGAAVNLAQFHLAFLDPPYGRGLGEQAMLALKEGAWLSPETMIVLEEQKSSLPDTVEGFTQVDRRDFGETAIGFFQQESA